MDTRDIICLHVLDGSTGIWIKQLFVVTELHVTSELRGLDYNASHLRKESVTSLYKIQRFNYTEQSPSCEPNSHSASQDIPGFIRNPKVY